MSRGFYLSTHKIVVVDSLLTKLLTSEYSRFLQATNPKAYLWDPLLQSCVEGTVGDRTEKTV